MKISIVIHSDTAATVTRAPSWLERWLLGRTESTVSATWRDGLRFPGAYGWLYDTGRQVEPRVVDAIERTLTLCAVRARRESLVRR